MMAKAVIDISEGYIYGTLEAEEDTYSDEIPLDEDSESDTDSDNGSGDEGSCGDSVSIRSNDSSTLPPLVQREVAIHGSTDSSNIGDESTISSNHRLELSSHADTCAFDPVCLIVYDTGRLVSTRKINPTDSFES
jgi:hypothetical protein